MAMDYYSYNHKHISKQHEDEDEDEDENDNDYIDMEVSSHTPLFSVCQNTTVPPQNCREFEFQMSSVINVESDTTTSPADELFYMGKLLPLHLPPRLQMVQNLLQDSKPKSNIDFYTTPSTPFESCNVSPIESCQVSRELDAQEYFRVHENEHENRFLVDHVHKSWTKKLKAKIKALFGKSDQQSCSSAVINNQNPCDAKQGGKIYHRRSFSGPFKRRSSTTTTKLSASYSSVSSLSCSSSSSSSSSNTSNAHGLIDLSMLKRSSSENSEIESSLIQGAIAHCKQSCQASKTLIEVGGKPLDSSKFANSLDDQTTLCRG
ncbi:probable membrane-associated kinase regulator 4 [Amaranthus tricolor]|uniref:probable membrane-associated kinase regulator 4 n=1 Tax=Amaranthus tricolor TaxID=29722 RepID=UPI002584C45B|nr:probable membrane-associated kinase regulator 4 [Amaranthus tricolor]